MPGIGSQRALCSRNKTSGRRPRWQGRVAPRRSDRAQRQAAENVLAQLDLAGRAQSVREWLSWPVFDMRLGLREGRHSPASRSRPRMAMASVPLSAHGLQWRAGIVNERSLLSTPEIFPPCKQAADVGTAVKAVEAAKTPFHSALAPGGPRALPQPPFGNHGACSVLSLVAARPHSSWQAGWNSPLDGSASASRTALPGGRSPWRGWDGRLWGCGDGRCGPLGAGAVLGGPLHRESWPSTALARFAFHCLFAFSVPQPKTLVDLLHPEPAAEKRKHKLKRLVQAPNSFFMDVRCPGCFSM